MTNPTQNDRIREALLSSPHVDEILEIRTASTDGELDFVGVRVSLTNVGDVYALPPVIADVRHRVRSSVPEVKAVFVEPDVIGKDRTSVSTESIVFRGWD